MEVRRIVPSPVEILPTARPTDVKVTSPERVSIAPVIIELLLLVSVTLPLPLAISPEIVASPELFEMLMLPVSFEILPEISIVPE